MNRAELNFVPTRWLRPVVVTIALGASSSVLAQGYSTDIEIVRPVFSHKGLPGIDTPVMAAQPTMRTGILTQYERDPLILYQFGEDLGAVVKHRSVMQLGLSYDFTPNVSTRVIIPTAIHTSSDIPELDSDGFALEDISIGARFQILQVGGLSTGVRADFIMPTGSKESFHGEDGLRTGAGLLAMYEIGPFSALFDTNVMTRSKVELEEDWTLGTELAVNAGVRYWALPDRVAVWASELSKGGFTNFYSGGAENTVEFLAGVEYRPVNYLQFHLGAGRGLADGYGGTSQRIIFGAKFVPIPPPRPDYVVEAEEEISTEPPPDVAIEEILSVEKKWKEGELARVEEEAIVIRDPIQFEFDTANILSDSIATLRFVANLMNDNARIGQVVIEGHASEEGSYVYNYDLSIQRARAIWEQIIRSGVHPARMSYRGMGEVDPRKKGTEEAALAKNRRVDFHIVHRFGPLDMLPEYPNNILLPWSGQSVTVNTPEDLRKQLEEEARRQAQQADSEGLRQDEDAAETPVPAPEPESEEPAEREAESDEDATLEDPEDIEEAEAEPASGPDRWRVPAPVPVEEEAPAEEPPATEESPANAPESSDNGSAVPAAPVPVPEAESPESGETSDTPPEEGSE